MISRHIKSFLHKMLIFFLVLILFINNTFSSAKRISCKFMRLCKISVSRITLGNPCILYPLKYPFLGYL